jgi:transcriptional regulator with XRE-family HTH domain
VASVGERIALHRKRLGLSQAVVAGLLGRSAQWLSNIERGVRPADRYSILVPLAEILRVPLSELTGHNRAPSHASAAHHDTGQAVRLALSGHTFVGELSGPNGVSQPDPIDLDGLQTRVDQAWLSVHQGNYRHLSDVLPKLMWDCELAVWGGTAEDQDCALGLLAHTYQSAAAMMAKLGEPDAAWVAADRSAVAAARAGDVLLVAAGGFRLGHAFLSSGRPDQAERAASLAAEALERPALAGDANALVLWGDNGQVRLQVGGQAAPG